MVSPNVTMTSKIGGVKDTSLTRTFGTCVNDERRDTDAYHQEGQQKHLYHAVSRPRFFINEKVNNGNNDADGDIKVRYIKITI